jgi:hypothetical protein
VPKLFIAGGPRRGDDGRPHPEERGPGTGDLEGAERMAAWTHDSNRFRVG